MSELSDLWFEYQLLEKNGKILSSDGIVTASAKKIEDRIHEIQKGMGTSRYDFDKRRARNAVMATSSISGPPDPNSKPPTEEEPIPQASFTYEQARKMISDNDFNLLEDCAKDYEVKAILLADILMKINPENKTNFARRGQGINWALTKFYKDKGENNGT